MKFLRTIRLDDSDTQVYEHASTPGEWAVPGSFAFLDLDPAELEGKRLQAFRSGFLGTESFGWSTLVEIAEIDDDEYQQVIDRLAAHFIEHYGAPHIAAALPAAGEEAHYAATICEYPLHTLLAIERDFGEEGIVESLKVIRPNAADHANVKIWSFEEDD
ncbi:MAG: DUF6505 family protein [Gammaproteobacteria bacterium]|nr:DUF6505 family protein [Gammaproteobacteria bacterium]